MSTQIRQTCRLHRAEKQMLFTSWHSLGVLCLMWGFHYKKETENWRHARRQTERSFAGPGALSAEEAKGGGFHAGEWKAKWQCNWIFEYQKRKTSKSKRQQQV